MDPLQYAQNISRRKHGDGIRTEHVSVTIHTMAWLEAILKILDDENTGKDILDPLQYDQNISRRKQGDGIRTEHVSVTIHTMAWLEAILKILDDENTGMA